MANIQTPISSTTLRRNTGRRSRLKPQSHDQLEKLERK